MHRSEAVCSRATSTSCTGRRPAWWSSTTRPAGTSGPEDLDRRAEAYRNQGASYAVAVAVATGERVARVTFVFLTPDGAVERDLPDLDGAASRVRELVAQGQEVLVP